MSETTLNLHVSEVSRHDIQPSELIAVERSIVDLSEGYLGTESYGEFAAAQLLATRRALCSSPRDPAMMASARTDVARFSLSLRRALALSQDLEPHDTGTLNRTLVAATPALRAELLFTRNSEATGGAIEPELVPYALLALEALALLASDAGMKPVTYQSIVGLMREYRALIVLLAHLNSVMVWHPTALLAGHNSGTATPFSTLCTIMRASVPNLQLRARRPLVDLLEHVLQSDRGLTRILLLKALARDLPGRLMPIGHYCRPTMLQRLKNPRSAIQQWLMANASEDVVAVIARRIRRPAQK